MLIKHKLTKEQFHVIGVVTFGNILEWYEIYSFVYLAPILARLFFHFDSETSNLFSAFLLFGTGFISRPFGGIIFGRIGDLLGRKKAFIGSIIIMTIPTFLMGCLPTYASWGLAAPIMFYTLRFLQSIPASGEIPGTICYLYEYANRSNAKFITSWTNVGNQIGAILGIIETICIEYFMTDQSIMEWGWRISFWSGGLLGLFGIYLRSHLIETPVFKTLVEHHKTDHNPLLHTISTHKKPILLGTALGAIDATTFYLFATYIPAYIEGIVQLNSATISWIMIILLTLMTLLIPFFGKLGDIYSSKNILIFSSIFTILLLYPLYLAINAQHMLSLSLIGILYVLPIASITALYPYWVANIFHSEIRYTGVGLAFNFADGIIGGFSPAIALLLLQYSGIQGAFCWFVLACSLISLIAYTKLKEHSYSQ